LENLDPTLIIECDDFQNGGNFPLKYTHRGEEVSPKFFLKDVSPLGKTIAIIFDDVDQPMLYWRIWNIPAAEIIPENLPKNISDAENAIPKNVYRGPNPPKGVRHQYQFNFFVLDCVLLITHNANKKQLEKAMEGHVVQYGFINGYFE
jgi:Raf kinase inhibitor-like YbhB/YbcL family protein